MVDPINWFGLAAHLLSECEIYEPDPIKAERMAVNLYTAIWSQWQKRDSHD